MSLSNCARCGRLFNRMTRDICPDCVREEEQLFETIKRYIRDHEGASAKEVSEALDVPEAKILHYLKEGRLEITSTYTYPCEACGKSIRSGQYCDSCRASLGNTMSEAAQLLKQEINSKSQRPAYFSRQKTRDK